MSTFDPSVCDLRFAFERMVPQAGCPAYESPLMTVEETAAYLNKNKLWVYRVLRHQIPVVKIGRQIFFEKREVDAYIARCRQVPPQ